MKNALQIITTLLCAVMLSGCIDAESTVIIKKDGSGFIVESMCFSAQAQQMMEGMKGMAQGMGGETNVEQSDPMKPTEAELKERAAKLGEGVQFVSTKEKTKPNGSKGYTATYSFSDVTKIKVSLGNDAGENKQGAGSGASGKKKEQPPVTFGFTPGKTAKLTVNLPRQEKDPNAPPPPEITPEMKQQMAMGMGMMGSMFKGMRMRMMIKVDGEISSTTAKNVIEGKKSGKKQYVVLYDIDFDKLMTNQDLFTELMLVQEQGGDMDAVEKKIDAIDGISIETADKVTISFK